MRSAGPAPGSSTVFTRLSRALADRPRLVTAFFIAVLAASGLYGARVAEGLQAGGLDVPGAEYDLASAQLTEHLGVGAPDLIAILHREDGDVRDPAFATFVLDGIEQLYDEPAIRGTTSHYDTGLPSLVSLDGTRTLLLLDLEGSPAEQVAALPRVTKLLRDLYPGVEIGGPTPASELAQRLASRDIAAAEVFALPFAALLTLFFFRSAIAALLPIAIGGFALAISAAVVRFASEFTEVSIFALNVNAFLALGLSIDYALLIVQRYREELPRCADRAEALAATLDTAGRAVWVSGLTVMISLAVLFVVPVPLLTSIAFGGILAVASAMLGALLLLAALLAWLGPNLNRWRIGRAQTAISGASPFWARIAEFAMRHPILTAGSCALILIGLAIPSLRMRAVLPDARTFPASEVRRVEERLADAAQFDPSGASAIQVVIRTQGPAMSMESLSAIQPYLQRLRGVPGVREVRTPLASLDPRFRSEAEIAKAATETATEMQLSRTVHEDLALVTALGRHPWRTDAAAEAVEAIRALPHPGLEVSVGGPTAMLVDIRSTLSGYAPLVGALVVGWNLIVLFLAFRSVLVPIKAAIMNLLSLGASYGALVLVFQDGHLADLLRFESPGGIEPVIPLILAAVVFGLSMDYEIFLLSRIQEDYYEHRDNRRSITTGLSFTGRIITSAALILLVVIGAFAAGELIFVKEIGVGMAAAIALDVTLVRALLVPSTMRLLGDWNWWAPRWLGGGRSVTAGAPHAVGAERHPSQLSEESRA
jgi:RND superfamily putative drug exporter